MRFQTDEQGKLIHVIVQLTKSMPPIPRALRIIEATVSVKRLDIVEITYGVSGIRVECILREGRTEADLIILLREAAGLDLVDEPAPALVRHPQNAGRVQNGGAA